MDRCVSGQDKEVKKCPEEHDWTTLKNALRGQMEIGGSCTEAERWNKNIIEWRPRSDNRNRDRSHDGLRTLKGRAFRGGLCLTMDSDRGWMILYSQVFDLFAKYHCKEPCGRHLSGSGKSCIVGSKGLFSGNSDEFSFEIQTLLFLKTYSFITMLDVPLIYK